ncbi:hypothetical protein G2W53_031638 [Senna tora]|uniref:Uncharacterized protein n=1 Tax=Senna tora TaxID=362788 RepID=A0A834WHX6_9FABA|nr:hypothetical protein G2W53_031638 [Senna tora]
MPDLCDETLALAVNGQLSPSAPLVIREAAFACSPVTTILFFHLHLKQRTYQQHKAYLPTEYIQVNAIPMDVIVLAFYKLSSYLNAHREEYCETEGIQMKGLRGPVEKLNIEIGKSGKQDEVSLETGLFEFSSGVLSENIAPEDACGVRPHKETGGPNYVTVETERFSARACKSPPIYQFLFFVGLIVFHKMPIQKLVYGVWAFVQEAIPNPTTRSEPFHSNRHASP